MSFTHVHQSGKWSATGAEWDAAVAARLTEGTVVTFTETTDHHPTPPAGWSQSWFAAPGSDASGYFHDAEWEARGEYTLPIARTRYQLGGKKLKPRLHAHVMPLKHKPSSRGVAFVTIHFPSAVEGEIAKNPAGKAIRFPRIRAYFEALGAIHKVRGSLKATHPGFDVVLSADWNLDFHKPWVRAFIKARFPRLTVSWRRLPAGGDLGPRLISASLHSAGLQTFGSTLGKRAAGFDHLPYKTVYRFKKAKRHPNPTPPPPPAPTAPHGFMPGAINLNIAPGTSDPAIIPAGVIQHVAVSNSPSLHGLFSNDGGIESHFYIRKDGTIEQYRSIFFEADAQFAGNSFGSPRRGFISVEHEGGVGADLNAPMPQTQLDAFHRVVLWVKSQADFPLRVCPAWDQPGVGYHAMFDQWNTNHHSCPGPARIAQFKSVTVPWLANPKGTS